MSYEMHHIGGRGRSVHLLFVRTLLMSPAFNHDQSSQSEEEYDRLRGLAREEVNKRNGCFERVCLQFTTIYLSHQN